MKQILTIFFVMMIAPAFAQKENLDLPKVLIMPPTLKVAPIDVASLNNLSKAKKLYENEKGTVYQLLLDNMKCLVPNINSNMPNASLPIQGYIPNARL